VRSEIEREEKRKRDREEKCVREREQRGLA
jgi:hypothetical protein